MASKKRAVAEKIDTFTKEQNVKVLKTAATITPEALNKTLMDVTSKITELGTVATAVELKKKELETIFGKEAVLKELEQLEVDLANAKQANETDLEKFFANTENQRNQLTLQREQDNAQFEFDREQQRRQQNEQFEEQQRQKRLAVRELEETREKLLKEREANVTKFETEFKDLQAKVANFQVELDKAEKRGAAITENRLTKDFGHQNAMLMKERETDQKINANTIATLTTQLTASEGRIAALQADVKAANDRAASIAEKALESASGQNALAAIQQYGSGKETPSTKSSKV